MPKELDGLAYEGPVKNGISVAQLSGHQELLTVYTPGIEKNKEGKELSAIQGSQGRGKIREESTEGGRWRGRLLGSAAPSKKATHSLYKQAFCSKLLPHT